MDSRPTDTLDARFGLWAETRVAEHLVARGYRVLDRNFRRPWGEIDLVAQWRDTIVFVEVKASQRTVAGFTPHERANQIKLRKVTRTAQTWLAQRGISAESSWQIDVVAIVLASDRRHISIQHFKNVTVG